MDCNCKNWVREFEEPLISVHHPTCQNRNIELEAKEHIKNLILALEYEGSMGDGISEDYFDKYLEARHFIGLKNDF